VASPDERVPPEDTGHWRPRVCFVGGSGRSGSTLLELCLGGLPGACAVGELVHLWERGVRDDELCGCGRHFHACPFWQAVGDHAFGGWEKVDVDDVLALKQSVDRTRFVPRLLAPHPGTSFIARVARYDELYRAVYVAALAVAGAQVVVDSSKHGSLAACLWHDPALDLRIVHVTRDSRGVAYSWSKRVARPEVTEGVAYMPRYSAAMSSAHWMAQNLTFEALAAAGALRIHVRYEDFVRDPAEVVSAVATSLGLDGSGSPGRTPRHVVLPPNHTVAGNPMRFTAGEVAVRQDEAWRSRMPGRRRLLVDALTWPLQARYGYLGAAQEARPARTASS
jgi:hypothetical protein